MKYLYNIVVTICILLHLGSAIKLKQSGDLWERGIDNKTDKKPEDSQVEKDVRELSEDVLETVDPRDEFNQMIDEKYMNIKPPQALV